MKRFVFGIFLLSLTVFSSGCSGTWEGVKSDSSEAWNATKKSIHEATK